MLRARWQMRSTEERVTSPRNREGLDEEGRVLTSVVIGKKTKPRIAMAKISLGLIFSPAYNKNEL